VSRFLENATRLLEAAQDVAGTGRAPAEMTVLIGESGGIQLLAGNDWPLDSLAADRGARMAYRVRQTDGKVWVEGRSGANRCLFAAEQPAAVARRLLTDSPRYLLV
jgi:hypothetical protein